MPQYHIWTIGCQMNQAESRRIDGIVTAAGYDPAARLDAADLVVLNTCVVRQSAEDRTVGTLGLLAGMKRERPDLKILVTGCYTARDRNELERRFPYVDLFFGSGEFSSLSSWLGLSAADASEEPMSPLPSSTLAGSAAEVSAYVPIIQGCNNFCTYCIVPYTRGRERSRTLTDIMAEVTALVDNGVKEVILLGQNVDSYGHDLPGAPSLADLLETLHSIPGLQRLRFLTNHPKDMSRRLIDTMASLDKVCEHLDLALQSGDDDILKAMGRGYTADLFRELIASLRSAMPRVSIATDIIVGFPGESDSQFENTFNMLKELRFDTVHIAAYSPRPGTVAWRRFSDSVPAAAKQERLQRVETLQETIATEINRGYLNRTVEVLVQGVRRGKWYGRTRTNKLVFFQYEGNCHGQSMPVIISKTSPWALQGNPV